jgi:hypothetical protein
MPSRGSTVQQIPTGTTSDKTCMCHPLVKTVGAAEWNGPHIANISADNIQHALSRCGISEPADMTRGSSTVLCREDAGSGGRRTQGVRIDFGFSSLPEPTDILACYKLGKGVPQDTEEARQQFTLACDAAKFPGADPEAESSLAYCTEVGLGGKPDKHEAMRLSCGRTDTFSNILGREITPSLKVQAS